MKEFSVQLVADDSVAVSDGNLDYWLQLVIDSDESVVKVATEGQMYALRVAHKDGHITITSITTEDGAVFTIDDKGYLNHYPASGIMSTMDNYLDKLIDW
jgi:hypothetical protein